MHNSPHKKFQKCAARVLIRPEWTLGFRYCKLDNRSVLMESPRLVALRYNFLTKIKKLRDEGYNVIYLDETWFDMHDIAKSGRSDGSSKCATNNHV